MSLNARILPSLCTQLERASPNRPVALLMRHSVRDPLPVGDAGNDVPITGLGRRLAVEVGQLFGQRLRTLHTSPLVRCVQTAEALRQGAGVAVDIVCDRLLGDPGIYVVDGESAWRHWERLGHEGVMEHLVGGEGALRGMANPPRAARFLVQHMLRSTADAPGIHVFVTHDSLVTATAARLLNAKLGPDDWPWYLQAAFFWPDRGGVCVAYQDRGPVSIPGPLCALEEDDVIDFARREIADTVGLDSGARFFLAGGAFKTLLTGRPPRDLDLWAPSNADRERLIGALERRGAQHLAPRAFADAYLINGRVVEVPHKVEPSTLEERLARFDIALSAVGVEHLPGRNWRAIIHPLAIESARRREVLLLKPLVNWKYALTTLERSRRYAAELAFKVPHAEEDEVWRVFSNQPADVRRGMVERYQRTATGTHGVQDEPEDVDRHPVLSRLDCRHFSQLRWRPPR